MDNLGVSHAQLLRTYVIATEKGDARFRHVDLIREGWSSDDRGHSLTHGRIVWAAYIPKLKQLGRVVVEAAVAQHAHHCDRVDALDNKQLEYIAGYEPVIATLARERGWSWRRHHPDLFFGEATVRPHVDPRMATRSTLH